MLVRHYTASAAAFCAVSFCLVVQISSGVLDQRIPPGAHEQPQSASAT
eukprot:COSAG04_NODE_2175_length_4628_cov_4.893133_5_plen_48_part_00